MTAKEHKAFIDNIQQALEISVEKTLRRKAALGESVVYAHPDGTPYTLPATETLNYHRWRNESFPRQNNNGGTILPHFHSINHKRISTTIHTRTVVDVLIIYDL